MLKQRARLLMILMASMLLIFSLAGCGKEKDKVKVKANYDGTCMSCHSDYDYLYSKVAKSKGPLGNEVSREAKAKGLLVSESFMKTVHGQQTCESCHNGNAKATDVADAHSGNFIVDPTADGGSKCGTCHKEQTKGFDKSLHFTISGIENKFTERLGSTPNKDKIVKTVMEKDCSACHATCGTCHVSTPVAASTGLQKGHNFVAKPNNLQVCTPCHHLAGPTYFTEKKDLHVKKGLDCLACHKQSQEFHGRNQPEKDMTAGVIQANCKECHRNVDTSNAAHTQHTAKVACWSCHTNEYESCNGCHSRKPDNTETFRLAQVNGVIYPFIRSVANADMFKHLGIELDQNILNNSRPTWHPYTPHFIAKKPIHKAGATRSCENCHGNQDIFLQKKDLTNVQLEEQFLVKDLPKSLK